MGGGSVPAGVLLELLADDVLEALGLVGGVGVGGLGVEVQPLHGPVVLLSDHVDPVLGQRVGVVVLWFGDEEAFAVGQFEAGGGDVA